MIKMHYTLTILEIYEVWNMLRRFLLNIFNHP